MVNLLVLVHSRARCRAGRAPRAPRPRARRDPRPAAPCVLPSHVARMPVVTRAWAAAVAQLVQIAAFGTLPLWDVSGVIAAAVAASDERSHHASIRRTG